jgi:tetratricopeptide (TPR) repeat protein
MFTIAGVILFVALAAGIPIYMWMQPAQRAKREYQAGLRAQLAGDFPLAQQHYRTALQLDPQFGLAAFSMGTTYLRIGDPAMLQSVEQITQNAVQGRTQELDEADRWFEQAATIGQSLPASTRLMDQRISSPARLRAFARSCLALTAMIRASAAMQADQLEDGMAWLRVAGQQAQAAVADDPQNPAANQILRAAGSMGG